MVGSEFAFTPATRTLDCFAGYPCVPARAVSNFVQTAPVNERIL